MLVKLIDTQCPVGGRVELKVGAQVSVCTSLFGKEQQIRWHKKNEGIIAIYIYIYIIDQFVKYRFCMEQPRQANMRLARSV